MGLSVGFINIVFIKFKQFNWLNIPTMFICRDPGIIIIFLIFIVTQLQLYAFSPHPSTPPQLNRPPSPTSPRPRGFVHVSFIVVPVLPSSHCPAPGPAGSAGQALGRCANLCPFLINCILRLSFISFLKFFEY